MKKVFFAALVAVAVLNQGFETGGKGVSIDTGKKLDYRSIDTGGVKLPPDGKKVDFETGGVVTADKGSKKVD